MVTGASRGIGAATAQALDRAGGRVALVARGRAELAEVAGTLHNDPVILPADLRRSDTPAIVARQAIDALGTVDVLVNNAAVAARLATIDLDATVIDDMLAVNVRAPLLLIAAMLPSMIQRGSGSIINLSSVSGIVGTPAGRLCGNERRHRRCHTIAGHRARSGRDPGQRSRPRGRRHRAVGQEQGSPRGRGDDRRANATRSMGHAGGHRGRDRVPRLRRLPIRHR